MSLGRIVTMCEAMGYNIVHVRVERGCETADGHGHHWSASVVRPDNGGYTGIFRGEASDSDTAIVNLEDRVEQRLQQEVLGLKTELETKTAALRQSVEPK